MRTRFTPLVVIIVVIIMSMALAGCERERPAPTPEGGTPGVLLPVGTGTVEGAGSQTVGTPVPLDAASPTPALLRPAATAEPLAQPAATSGSAASAPGTYTVQRGDTLGSIGGKFGVSTKEILAVNPTITNPDVLAVGQQIKLPSGGSAGVPAASTGGSTASSGAGQTYTVQKGDILATIARKYGVTVAALQQANNLSNPNKIIVGQKLTIPAGGSAAPAAASSGQTRNYTVQRGDTMSTIAVKFGVTVAALQQANGITNPDKITVGQVLKIP